MAHREIADQAMGAVSAPSEALTRTSSPAETLVGIGFRNWLAGYQTGDIACWEVAWTAFSEALGSGGAKCALSELACWVRAINGCARRRIEVYPAGCARFCRDECMAISMIAAGQHGACPALKACALALVGSPAIDDVVATADSFAATLSGLDLHLSPRSICNAVALCGMSPSNRQH